MVEKFDCIVVSSGMSGNAAAYVLAKRGLSVLQLERGEYSESKNVQGAIMYADMLDAIIPEFRENAPLERHLIEQRFWMMNGAAHTGIAIARTRSTKPSRTATPSCARSSTSGSRATCARPARWC